MIEELEKIKQLYNKGVNIAEYLKCSSNSRINTTEMIMISYDLQAGNYIKKASENPEWENQYSKALAEVLKKLGKPNSILEVGVGEATTLINVMSKLSSTPGNILGFDISYSRIRYAIDYCQQKKMESVKLFMGDLFSTPIMDNSIDVVYTSHSIEPNGGREKEALNELYRVTNRYLVLFEPSYEFAGDKAKKYMEKHGYIRNLYSTAIESGFKVVENKLLFESNPLSLNNTGVLIIEKNRDYSSEVSNYLACPITKAPLELIRNNYFCKKSLLLYPVLDGIPCLLPNNAIIATKYLDD